MLKKIYTNIQQLWFTSYLLFWLFHLFLCVPTEYLDFIVYKYYFCLVHVNEAKSTMFSEKMKLHSTLSLAEAPITCMQTTNYFNVLAIWLMVEPLLEKWWWRKSMNLWAINKRYYPIKSKTTRLSLSTISVY